MYYTGFADEAGGSIDVQIRATKELGWENIEARKVDGAMIHDMPDEAFDVVCGKLEDAGVKINCFGSAIANWGKQITGPFDSSLGEAKRSIARMERLGTKLVRMMSFAVLRDRAPDDQLEEERFARVRELVKMFSDHGMTCVHENCMNYGGMGWTYTLRLLENVPGMKLVYDTGNPVFTYDYAKGEPYPKQSSWEFYSHVKEHIAYVHIKDAIYEEETGGTFPKAKFTFAGDGDGDVRRIVADLVANGYDGGFSMEPHLAVVHHEAGSESDDDIRYNNYVEYGRRFMELVESVK